MKAIVAHMWGEPATLEYTEVFPPALLPGQALIDVEAIGCNFPDILIVQGRYQKKPPLPFSPGAEVAGVVRDVGPGVTQVGVGERVVATAGSPEKLEVARVSGADVLVNYRTEDWVERVKKETDGRGADVIYDPVGGDVFDGSTRCIAFEGRLLVIGFTSGRIADVATNRVLLKNISIVGVHWGLYSERDPVIVRRWMVELLKLAEAGQLKPVVSKTFPLREATRALAAIASRESYGKVVLVP